MRARSGIVIGLFSLARVLPAQEWYLSTEAGRIRSALDPAAAAPSVSLGLRFENLATGLRISAGVPTRSDEALWGGIGASTRWSRRAGSFLAGLDVLGNAFALVGRSNDRSLPGPGIPPVMPDPDRRGHALAGQAMPLIGYENLRFQFRARSGVSHYASRIIGQERDRTVHLSDAQLTWMPASSVALSPMVQHVRPTSEAPSTFVGASAIGASATGSLWAMVGRWASDSNGDLQWSAGARLRLHPNVSLDGAARRGTFDPLYLQPAQTSWSVGLSVLLGRARVVAPPVPAAYSGGRALIRLPVSASKSTPSIAGDFNDWKPAPMKREGDQWTYTVAIAPGVYNYAFVNGSGEWFVPESVAGRKDDGMGGHVAVLVVK